MSSSSFGKIYPVEMQSLSYEQKADWILVEEGELKGTNIVVDSSTEAISLSTRYCRDTERWRDAMPSLDMFASLQYLDLHNSRYLIGLDDSIVSLQNLKVLILTKCDRLEHFPEIPAGGLPQLQEINFYDSPKISNLPESIGELKSLRRLIFGGSSGHHNRALTILPDGIGLLENLEELLLDKCKALKELPVTVSNLSKLTRLSMKECKSLKYLPESIGRCKQLVELSLLKCVALSNLPDSIGDLTELEDLVLGKCKSLTALPRSLGNLQRLTLLDLHQCKGLRALPDEVGDLKALHRLDCRSCKKLVALPSQFASLPSLREVDLSDCVELNSIPEALKDIVIA